MGKGSNPIRGTWPCPGSVTERSQRHREPGHLLSLSILHADQLRRWTPDQTGQGSREAQKSRSGDMEIGPLGGGSTLSAPRAWHCCWGRLCCRNDPKGWGRMAVCRPAPSPGPWGAGLGLRGELWPEWETGRAGCRWGEGCPEGKEDLGGRRGHREASTSGPHPPQHKAGESCPLHRTEQP